MVPGHEVDVVSRTIEPAHDTLLLLTLGEVSALVSHSHNLAETLRNIVEHIRSRFQTDVCSVYTVERETGELVLSATVGLRPESIGQVRMPLTEGLTGLVAECKAPVAVADAPKHPRYRYFPESGEEQYPSFLGVPLIQGGVVQGVLVVQDIEPRLYSANEVRMLVAVAAQLAILVTNARLTRDLSDAVRQQPLPPAASIAHARTTLHGQTASPGIAHGHALRFEPFDFESPSLVQRRAGTLAEERELLDQSLEGARRDIDEAARYLAELLGEQFGALVQAQRLLLEDFTVQNDLTARLDGGASVEEAIVAVCRQYLCAFEKLENPYFYERIYDIKDVFRRLLNHTRPDASWVRTAQPVIFVAHEVSLLELFSCDLVRVRGIVIERGGVHSHVAILARSLGIPMMSQTAHLLASVAQDDELVVDADTAVVYVNPDSARREICLKLLEARRHEPEAEVEKGPAPLRLEATVNLLPEVTQTVRFGGEAVGLYRSEFLELARRAFPSEEEQFDIYCRMLDLLDGRALTLRTLDLRADKLFGIDVSDPRALSWDWRMVDRLPHVQELITTQLRAALRSATHGTVRVLFPMMTSDVQLDCALQLLDKARASLADEGLAFESHVPVGVMIEVPAAVMMARSWAKRVAFLSVGTNDLLHSLFGIERDEDQLLPLKNPLNPCFLRAVRHVIRHAHAHGRPVTICGDAANYPQAMLALYALGADALSIPPDGLPSARKLFRDVVLPKDRNRLAHELLLASDTSQVDAVLRKSFHFGS